MNGFIGPVIYELCKGIGSAFGIDSDNWLIIFVGIALLVIIVSLILEMGKALYRKTKKPATKTENEASAILPPNKAEQSESNAKDKEAENAENEPDKMMNTVDILNKFSEIFGDIKH